MDAPHQSATEASAKAVPAAPAGAAAVQPPMPGWPALLTVDLARAYLQLGEDTFAEERRKPYFPKAIQLNAKVVRFARSELDEVILQMPRQQKPSEPTQLLRARIERQKRTGQAA